ncbi:uncharacterized protein LOC131158419 isoform X2 [Malania oleifera]|uniref:uncharacterized protein LOC131158419 isoform X2 n=1 Tax=Malania oleifera TaxID=397392 RepID=UPI0025AE5357|nr:uncharacterized protein LOC131158419 isoform X2 [Malania oleifera]
MESEEERVKRARVVEARARNISHNVRCTECGSQSIEDSQADIAILLRKLIRDEIQAGKTDKEIFKKLEDDYGETVLYAPRFDMQTAALWLSPVIVGGVAAGVWAYSKHRKNTNVHRQGSGTRYWKLCTPTIYQMARIQATEGGTTEFVEPAASAPPQFQAGTNPAIGSPMFDWRENQMNASVTPTKDQVHSGNIYGSPQNNSAGGMVQNLPVGHPWSTGLFDCQEHQTNVIMTTIFPCVTFGQIAEILDRGEMSLTTVLQHGNINKIKNEALQSF